MFGSRIAPFLQIKKVLKPPPPETATGESSGEDRLLDATDASSKVEPVDDLAPVEEEEEVWVPPPPTYDGWMGVWFVPDSGTTPAGQGISLTASWAWTSGEDNVEVVPLWPPAADAPYLSWIKNATFTDSIWSDQPNTAKRKFVQGSMNLPFLLKYSMGSYMTVEMLDDYFNSFDMDIDTRLFWWRNTVRPGEPAGYILNGAHVNYTVSEALSTLITKHRAIKAELSGASSLMDAVVAVITGMTLL